jgi:hypothetical protein
VRRRVACLALLSLPLALLLAPIAAPAAEAVPWWCATGAVLTTDALPDALPTSACALDGRVVVGPLGYGAEVPPVAHGVAAHADLAGGAETVALWTDEYGVHVRGGQYAAALGYLEAMRAGTAPDADLDRMARAVRRMTAASIGAVRPLPLTAGALLDAGDALVAAPRDAAAARETLGAYLTLLVARAGADDSPAVRELRDMADDVRAVLRTGAVDLATADRALAEVAMLRSFLAAEVETLPDPARLDQLAGPVGDLGAELRAAIARAAPAVDTALLYDPFGATLADLADYLAEQAEPFGLPGLPGLAEPDVVDPTGLLAESSASPSACSDGARAALYPEHPHFARGKAIGWYYNHNNNPGFYDSATFAAVIKEAFDNVTGLHDDCGYEWHPNVGNRYLGVAQYTGVGSDGRTCVGDTDAYNVVGWRSVSATTDGELAFACVWHHGTALTGADVAVGRQWKWDIPEYNPSFTYPACTRYDQPPQPDFEAVLTHELGHVAGLGHVTESAHGNLTMSAVLNGYCERIERTPGRGDAIGLGNLYGRVS